MLLRNLLVLAVLGVGSVAFVATVFPKSEPTHWRAAERAVGDQDADFDATVQAVDAAFRAQWEEYGHTAGAVRPELAVARRISLALTGTAPSLEELRMYEDRPADGRLAWWTAGLLRDQRSSEYLAERLARAFVGVEDGPFLIYRRRRFVSWLAEELAANRPYDEIVRQLIASDGIWTNQPATNFITVSIPPGEAEKQPDETKLAGRVSRAFLGVRMDCAECHDHPFDVWKQDDFHQLAAFFGRTENSFTGIREGRRVYEQEDMETHEKTVVEPAVPFGEELLSNAGNRREQLAVWVTHPQNRAFARAAVNRTWALLMGRALVEPVDNLPIEGEVPKALDLLADDFAGHDFDLRRLVRLITTTEVFHLDSLEPPSLSDAEIDLAVDNWAIFPMTRLRPEQVVGALLQACSVQTIDFESHIIMRLARSQGQNDFVKRDGDFGEDEFGEHGGTIPQRLIMLNGNIVKDKTGANYVANAAPQLALLAPTDADAVESAYLCIFTRRPTAAESRHFEAKLEGKRGNQRAQAMEDIFSTLLNSTEFSWNH